MSVVADLEFAKLRKNQQLFNLVILIVNELILSLVLTGIVQTIKGKIKCSQYPYAVSG